MFFLQSLRQFKSIIAHLLGLSLSHCSQCNLLSEVCDLILSHCLNQCR
ncbi:mCG1027729 [Mus musculus]|nr:mCG1027729 [Mus musculus]